MPTLIGVSHETSPKGTPSISAKTQNLDALVVGGGKNSMNLGRKGLVRRSNLSTSTVTGLANGVRVVSQAKITNVQSGRQGVDISAGTETNNLAGNNIIAIVERSVYVGSVVAANLLPGGANIDESQWQLVGDRFTTIDADGTAVPLNELVNHYYIRNISAGTVNLIIHVYVRYVLNDA